MRYLERELGAQILLAAKTFPAVVLTGPRRAGKTGPGVKAVGWRDFVAELAPE